MVIILIMVTTVQLSEKSKKELYMIKGFLEQKTGAKQSLDDTVQWLIAYHYRTHDIDRKKSNKELFGIARHCGVSIKDLSELRKEKGSRFEDI